MTTDIHVNGNYEINTDAIIMVYFPSGNSTPIKLKATSERPVSVIQGDACIEIMQHRLRADSTRETIRRVSISRSDFLFEVLYPDDPERHIDYTAKNKYHPVNLHKD